MNIDHHGNQKIIVLDKIMPSDRKYVNLEVLKFMVPN